MKKTSVQSQESRAKPRLPQLGPSFLLSALDSQL